MEFEEELYVLIENENFIAISDDEKLIIKYIGQRKVKANSEILKLTLESHVSTIYTLYNNLELEAIGDFVFTSDEKIYLNGIIKDEMQDIDIMIHTTKRILKEYKLSPEKIKAFESTIKHLKDLKKHEYILYCDKVNEYIVSCLHPSNEYITRIIW